jgi:hypothetical protein
MAIAFMTTLSRMETIRGAAKFNHGTVCNDTHISLLPVLQQVSRSISSLATAGKSSNERNKFQEIEEEATKSTFMSSLVQNMRKLSTDIRAARKDGEDEDIVVQKPL